MTPVYEGFAIQTADGLIFTVKGVVHPPHRVIAYLRYLPDPHGDRERDGVRYRRVYHFEEQQKMLEARSRSYFSHDPVYGLRLQSVPRQLIRKVYDPCQFLATLVKQGPVDLVEEHALELADTLRQTAGLPWANLGVTGSVLLGLHGSESDIDLVAYGERAGQAIHRALLRLLDASAGPLRRLSHDELTALHALHQLDTPLSFASFRRLQSRKVNEGRFRGRQYFIRFVKRPTEVGERYGDRRFESLGVATIQARVTGDRDAIFTPCCYPVEDVTFVDGPHVADLQEIVSFRGRFSDQVRTGELAVARGSLERVIHASDRTYHRLVIGGQAGDYLLSQASDAFAGTTREGKDEPDG